MCRRVRNQKGAAITEFAPALIVLICFVFLPLLNIAFIPFFGLVTQGALNEFTHRISLSEKRSDAYNQMYNDHKWRDFLAHWGVKLHDPNLTLVVCGQDESELTTVQEGQDVPADYLPGGSKGPCIYSLVMTVKADIPPICSTNGGMPGLTAPITIPFRSRSQWENFGRDPQTSKFFINE